MRVPVTINGYVDLPDDEGERIDAYGEAEPEFCVRLDLDTDAGAFFQEQFMFTDDDIIVGDPK